MCTIFKPRLKYIVHIWSSSTVSNQRNIYVYIYIAKYIVKETALHPRSFYIGYTRTTLSGRLTIHLQNGPIQSHYMDHHDCRVSRTSIVERSTTIIKKIIDFNRLTMCEAMLIKLREPR